MGAKSRRTKQSYAAMTDFEVDFNKIKRKSMKKKKHNEKVKVSLASCLMRKESAAYSLRKAGSCNLTPISPQSSVRILWRC